MELCSSEMVSHEETSLNFLNFLTHKNDDTNKINIITMIKIVSEWVS